MRATGIDGRGWRGSPWWYVAPLAAVFAAFVVVPVIGTCLASFSTRVPFADGGSIGLDNYRQLLSDPAFWRAGMFTGLFVAVSVPLEMALGFGVALLLHAESPWRSWLRACVLIPWAIPAVVSGRIWELWFNYQLGLANAVCLALHVPGAPFHWLGTVPGAFAAVVLADVWKTVPFVAVILLAGLQAIPEEVERQAQIDGASALQRCWRITLPLLKPVCLVAVLFRTADALRIFDLVYVLTHGGPGGATTSLSLYAYDYYLLGDVGYGSTVSVVLFLLTMGLSLLYLRAGRFREALHG